MEFALEIALIFFWLLTLILDYLTHRKNSNVSAFVAAAGAKNLREMYQHSKHLGSVKTDLILAPLLYVGIYCGIVASFIAFHKLDNWLIKVALAIFVAGRLRALQEISHFAVHSSLCSNKSFSLKLANVFFQFPCFKPDADQRVESHVRQHHPNANDESKDPNLADFKKIGFLPGISRFKFIVCFCWPLTPMGLWERLREMSTNQFCIGSNRRLWFARQLVVSGMIGTMLYWGFVTEFFALFLLPMVVIYPLFSWISQVVEHRWFVDVNSNSRWEREMTTGRPTDYAGISGELVRGLVFPFGDSFHLAHSLFPNIRWNYLSVVDATLKSNFPEYTRFNSLGLFWSRDERPSALSELWSRLVCKTADD